MSFVLGQMGKFNEHIHSCKPQRLSFLMLIIPRYFSQRAEKSKIDDGEDSEAGSVSDSEFDEYLGEHHFNC